MNSQKVSVALNINLTNKCNFMNAFYVKYFHDYLVNKGEALCIFARGCKFS